MLGRELAFHLAIVAMPMVPSWGNAWRESTTLRPIDLVLKSAAPLAKLLQLDLMAHWIERRWALWLGCPSLVLRLAVLLVHLSQVDSLAHLMVHWMERSSA